MASICLYPVVAALGVVSLPAIAADRPVRMRVPAEIRRHVAALPQIAAPVDDAERRINAAAKQLDRNVRRDPAGCVDPGGDPGWKRTVEVPMRGPGYISFVIRDFAFCGGAHPAEGTMAIVYDLRTGLPVDWTKLLPSSLTGTVKLTEAMAKTKMVTLASKRLYALYIAGYQPGGDAEDQNDCKKAVRRTGDEPPAMMAWLDAKRGGLAVWFDLSQVDQNCEMAVVIPIATLRAEGVPSPMLGAIGAAKEQ